MKYFYALGIILCFSKLLQAQEIFLPDSIKKQTQAVRIEHSIKIDGKLEESAWNTANPITNFVQVEPFQKQEASQKSVFKLLYNKDYLYIAAILHEPLGKKALRVTNLQRDFDYGRSDQIGISIDGFNDERNAMIFMTNPYGSQRDLLAFDDQVFDEDWDGLWRVRTSRTDTAWIAEFSIPWQTLRYQRSSDFNTWGINFFRMRRMTNEQTIWSALPRSFTPARMQYAGKLSNISPPPPKANIRFQPYLLISEDKYDGSEFYDQKNGSKIKMGGEIKWAITPNTVLDLTYNTDFAQADADRQVNNLSRLSVFFPERRQFFLENASLFAAGLSPIEEYFGGQQRIQPFFSRRIGLDAEGNPVPIVLGARIVNRSTKSNTGFMYVRQKGNDINSATDFLVGRYSQNIGKQNRIGGIATLKNDSDHANITASADGFFRINESTSINTMAMTSKSTNENSTGLAAHYQLSHRGIDWMYWLTQNVNNKAFNPEMGFVSRPDVIENSAGFYWLNRGKWLPKFVRAFEPGGYYLNYYSTTTGKLIEQQWNTNPIWFTLQNGGGFGVLTNHFYQLIDYTDGSDTLSFFNVPIQGGKFKYDRYMIVGETDASKKISLSMNVDFGKYYNGSLTTFSSTFRFAPIPHISMEARFTNNSYSNLGVGKVAGNNQLYTISGRFALNPRVQLIGFYQHNSISDFDVWNVRFSWEYQPLSFLYLVFNQRGFNDFQTQLSNDGLTRIRTNQLARQHELHLIAKLSYLKQF